MEKEKIRQLVALLYKDETGKPFQMTDGQCELFHIINSRKFKRVHCLAHTRYGKSLITALAVLTRVSTYPEKWAIVAGRQRQAAIIMSYIIEHTFDNEYTKQKLELDPQESMERLRRERSKSRLVFKVADGQYGEVFILSAEAKNQEQAANALMGFGATGGVILDEAALINDQMEAKVFRMLADKPDTVYIKIGNPFFRNHFLKDYQNPDFKKLNFDYKVGIKEGRITQDFINEAKKKPQFDVLYENKFPEESALDDKGWSRLITDTEYENALVELPQCVWFGEKALGIDIARGGGCFNVWTMRCANYATQLGKNEDNDLMSVTGTTIRLGKENEIQPENWFPDDIGTGGGVSDRLKEQNYHCRPVKFSEKAVEERFENKRAECYWKLKEWIASGGKLNAKQDWTDLTKIKYKAKDSTGRLIIMSKDEMRKQGIESPDVSDSLANTFAEVLITKQSQEEIKQAKQDDLEVYL